MKPRDRGGYACADGGCVIVHLRAARLLLTGVSRDFTAKRKQAAVVSAAKTSSRESTELSSWVCLEELFRAPTARS